MKKIIVIVLLCLAVALPYAALADFQPTVQLKYLSFTDGHFRIVQFSDFHEWMAQESKRSSLIFDLKDTLKPALEDYINSVLDIYKPDLVVLTGDNIFPLSFLYDFSNKVGVNTYKRIADIFEDKEQYWTLTFGNHDSECVANKIDLLKAVRDYKYFVGGHGNSIEYQELEYIRKDEAGIMDDRYGNFSIPIYGKQEKITYNIYLFDSGSYNFVPHGKPYRYILDAQADWYKDIAQSLKEANGGQPVFSIAFTHIPLLEHEEAYLQNGEQIGSWTIVSPSDTRSRIFEDMLTSSGMRAIFTGHNHCNSITCFYQSGEDKIMMGITPQAAADSYEYNNSIMKCRIIDLDEADGLVTFIDTSNPEYENRIDYGQTLAY